MNRLGRTLLGSTTVAGLATLAPLSLDPGAAASGGSPVRLNLACGQSMTCMVAQNWVCVGPNGIYYLNYKCTMGCS